MLSHVQTSAAWCFGAALDLTHVTDPLQHLSAARKQVYDAVRSAEGAVATSTLEAKGELRKCVALEHEYRTFRIAGTSAGGSTPMGVNKATSYDVLLHLQHLQHVQHLKHP